MEMVFLSPLSLLLGKNVVGGECSVGREVQNKLSEPWPAATCQQIPTMASGP